MSLILVELYAKRWGLLRVNEEGWGTSGGKKGSGPSKKLRKGDKRMVKPPALPLGRNSLPMSVWGETMESATQ